MARVKRGVTAHAKHKKVLEQAKGFYGRRKNTIRSLWIQRINAGARTEGFTYSQFIHGLDVAGIVIDRKVLSDIAGADPVAFKAIADKVRTALAA
jgi:large subunit ribosomal protein L20